MKVGFSSISFKADAQAPQSAPQNVSPEVKPEQDKFVQENSEGKKHRKTLKERFGNVWKFFAATDELSKGYAKAVLWGGAAGVATAGVAWIFRALPKAFVKEGPGLKEVIKHPLKHIGKAGKVISGVAAAAVFGYKAVVAHFNKNQRTAVIDHKLNVGHRES